MNKLTKSLCLSLPLFFAACAGYNIQPADVNTSWSSNDEGYLIYEPKPYLRVTATQTKDGPSFSSDIVYLPNLARPYRVTTWCFLAKSDITFGMTNGWMLTNVASKTDTTDIAKTVVDLAKGLAVQGVQPQEHAPAWGVYLFEIRLNEKTNVLEVAKEPSMNIELPTWWKKSPDASKGGATK